MLDFDPPLFNTIVLDQPEDGVLRLTVNRPDRMNSMTVEMFGEFRAATRALRDSQARALILTGAGDRAFCAGFDLAEIEVITRMSVREFVRFEELAADSVAAIRALPFPVIAAVHGAAAGGGLSLALSADIRLASPAAKFSAAFVKVGLSAGELGTSWQLTRLIGPGRAAEMAYTARNVDAAEAHRIGLVNRVVPAEDLHDEAVALARTIAGNSPAGVRMSKRALQANMEVGSYAAAMELENRGQSLLTRGADMPEALAAFKDKRQPRFTGQ
ncbi:MAG TPA: enoyl-CoA hydratase-related protein [Pseudonocardiaceae bacterium]|jgi:enoyl-CoA hydratase/carnithine racemase|nr:enoyl-CoA hydratase-related protein [Pseudonocardiaceae bacterium]